MTTGDDERIYSNVPTFESLRKVLEEKLAEYNESNAVMSLVLFQQAMEHICRIARIIDLPRGALLCTSHCYQLVR